MEKEQKNHRKTGRRLRIFPRRTDMSQEPHDEVEAPDAAATSTAQDGPVPLGKRLMDTLGDKTIAEALGDNSFMEIVSNYVTETIGSVTEAATKMSDLKDKYGSALLDEFKERVVRGKQQEEPEHEAMLAERTTFLGLRIPESLVQQLDKQREPDGLTKSDFVRDAVRLRLRMGGIAGDGLQEQLDSMLSEVMGERLAHSLVAILDALGPKTAGSILETSGAVLFYVLAYGSLAAEGLPLDGGLPFEKARKKAAEFVSELRAEMRAEQEGLGDEHVSESE